MFSLIPWLSKYFADTSDFSRIRSASVDLHATIKDMVMDQWQTYDATIERHFLDIYFKEIKEAERTGIESSLSRKILIFQKNHFYLYFSFAVEQLVMNCTDLILPALTTIASVMSLFVQRVLLQPEIGRNIQNEIERVVGHGRLPRLDDRAKYLI